MTTDREIAELLSVGPSPEFAARVRQRVALAPVPSRRISARALAAAAVLSCAVAIALGRDGREKTVVSSVVSHEPAVRASDHRASGDLVLPSPPARSGAAAKPPRVQTTAHDEFVQVPAMTYREIEPQRGVRPVADMQVHAVPPIEPAEGERPWSTL